MDATISTPSATVDGATAPTAAATRLPHAGGSEHSTGDASSLLVDEDQPIQSFQFEATTTLEAIRQMMAQFADERDWNEASGLRYHTPRNLVLALTGELGELCEIFQWKHDGMLVKDWNQEDRVHLGEELSDVLLYLVRLADKCKVDLPTVVHEKTIKNALKYPPSAHLQVPKTWEEPSIPTTSQELQSTFCFEPTTTLELVRKKTAHFADERGWNPVHVLLSHTRWALLHLQNLTPRNLLLALTGEVGELCEIFQWKGDHTAVADKCAVDLPIAVKDKMTKNAKKYPAELVKGSSKKYNEYKQFKLS
ncbi:Xtp3-transactivated protein, partial [Globisporangium splendens]